MTFISVSNSVLMQVSHHDLFWSQLDTNFSVAISVLNSDWIYSVTKLHFLVVIFNEIFSPNYIFFG